MSLGENIAKYRKEKGFTQEAVAKKLDVTNQAVSKWENNQCCPDTLLLPKIADILEVSIDALFGRELIITWESEDKIFLSVYDNETGKTSDYPGLRETVLSMEGAGDDFIRALFFEKDEE